MAGAKNKAGNESKIHKKLKEDMENHHDFFRILNEHNRAGGVVRSRARKGQEMAFDNAFNPFKVLGLHEKTGVTQDQVAEAYTNLRKRLTNPKNSPTMHDKNGSPMRTDALLAIVIKDLELAFSVAMDKAIPSPSAAQRVGEKKDKRSVLSRSYQRGKTKGRGGAFAGSNESQQDSENIVVSRNKK